MSTDTKNNAPLTDRRGFLAGGALLGAGMLTQVLAAAQLKAAEVAGSGGAAILKTGRPDATDPRIEAGNKICTSCLQCNTGCGITCKLDDGVITKIDGNPYNPWTLVPQLPYNTPQAEGLMVDGAICPKGQAGLQSTYDPFRLRKVLKRAGKRGENKWVTIPFGKAVEEVCEGGKLFAGVPGEEGRDVKGLRELVALRDGAIAKAMEADIKAIWDEKDKTKKKDLVKAFQAKHHDNLHLLIDREHPDFGPVNNQIVVAWGRLKDGRGDIYKRFAAGLGTTNAHGHTTVCQGSLYFTCKAISEQYDGGKFTGGQKFYWQADTEHSRFVLFIGANLFEANYGPPNRTVRMTENMVTGRTRIAVADPRFSKLASKAWKWLPVKPGTDAALAMGIMRWMIDENRIDTKFLACANKAAANAAGESSWCNGTWLVAIGKDGTPGKMVRAADVKIDGQPLRAAEKLKAKDGKEYDEKFLVVMAGGKPVAFNPNDDKEPVTGDLYVDATLPDGTRVKSGLQILKESTHENTVAGWAEICGLRPFDLVDVARELTSHGKQAAVDIHRGPAQHTNGFYNVLACMSINMLLGNFDAKGGMSKASTWDTKGKGKKFDIGAHPGKVTAFGISSIRHGLDYDKTTIFEGYPAKRNWYPLSSDIYEEIIPSMGDAYPYACKALFTYMAAPTYALPAGHTNIAVLCDTAKVPLHIACDILVGSTSMYADYIFPDTSFLERWEFQGSHPNMPLKVQPVRQPAAAPIPEEVTVYGNAIPCSLEAMCMGIAERLNLPGFGDNAFGAGLHLRHPDEYFLRAVANLAFGEKPDGSQQLPDASAEEIAALKQARRHLPKSVYDAGRWESIVGSDMWPKVVYCLNRGGRYDNHDKGWKGNRLANAYAALLNLYQEKTAGVTHAATGKKLSGIARYLPVIDWAEKGLGEYEKGYDLTLITHRVVSQTKSRTIANPWLSALLPENGVIISTRDAAAMGIKDGQNVKVVSATSKEGEWDLGAGKRKSMIGKAVVTQGIRPGVVSFALGFGHWATGANDITIDGHTVKGEERREAGIHANAAMWTDPTVTNTCMFDPVGGSVSFYDTKVKLIPV